ncbi:MAG: helix-turn-helix domain-containing protein [Clostridia bacterium]|nr:helix-turn-helix domain-containing protein [Clostridia bacterium]
MESMEFIKKYYEYLEQDLGLSVTLHCPPQSSERAFLQEALPIPEVHFNSYCTYIKQTLELHHKCLFCQTKAMNKCLEKGAFAGSCHAGVFEYVYPLKFGNKVVGSLNVGGYLSADFSKRAKEICAETSVDFAKLSELSRALKSEIPEKDKVDMLIVPLLCMIKNVSALQIGRNAKNPMQAIVAYCDRAYTKKITVKSLSEQFFCSESYIARNFKKETGKSLPEYINSLRIRNAMQLLRSTNSDIAQIGATVGYDDPSYFTKCFIKITGVSPREWRRTN